MPNFFSNAKQTIYERFNGPRTKDLEYDAKHEQVKVFEKNSNGLKSLFSNIQRNTLGKKINLKIKKIGMKNYFRDITGIIPPLYENTSPYSPNILEVSKYHNEIEIHFEQMVKKFKLTKNYSNCFILFQKIVQRINESWGRNTKLGGKPY